MPDPSRGPHRYTNPVLDHDVPDPDVVALPGGGFALVASSFDRAPGLPLWRSDDLLTWHPVGHAGGYRDDAPHDGGVWAPSIRVHGGRIHITWGDPDLGVFAVDAPALEGPWSAPRLVRAGRGLIDACPFWDEDGRAYIVHGYARSRAGFANRLDVFEVDPALTTALDAGRTIIDGDTVEGCTVLEGPKVYRRGGELWVFAPAGGVATGWQYAFRAPTWDGPWEHRIVLTQEDTDVNGPHQGAWVSGEDGEEWFLHFQAKGALGRVLHLQPLSWGADGWPTIGDGGRPVGSWPTPRGATALPPSPWSGDAFASGPDAGWHTRGAAIDDLVSASGDGALTLRGTDDAAVLRPLDGAHRRVEASVRACDGASAAFVVADAVVRELVRHPGTAEAPGLVEVVEHGPGGPVRRAVGSARPGARLGIDVDGDTAVFTLDGADVGAPFRLEGRRWTGAEWGLAARGAGTATFGTVVAHPVEVPA